MAHILIPLPGRDFDPTEVGVSWRVLTDAGHRVSFATPDGQPSACDPIMLTGRGLDPWSPVPLLGHLRALGLLLRADRRGRAAYRGMTVDAGYQKPLRWSELRVERFDGILLGGGHRARGMRPFLESAELQGAVASFFAARKPVAAICHGVLLVARSQRDGGGSVLRGRKTTALTWAQEGTASALARVGRFWDPSYYRTYVEEPGQPAGFMSVQEEVTRTLERREDFLDVPADDPHFRRKTLGLFRDTVIDDRPAFVVTDETYVSARWPGDTHTFANVFSRVVGS